MAGRRCPWPDRIRKIYVAACWRRSRRAGEAKPMGGGPAPRIRGAAGAAMLELAGGPDHLGLAGIAARLAGTHGVRVHLTTVHRALRRAGWAGKEVSLRAAEQA